MAEWFPTQNWEGSIRCPCEKWQGPGRDPASRPRPYRDRERLRTGRVSSISRIARCQECDQKVRRVLCLAFGLRLFAVRIVFHAGGSRKGCGKVEHDRSSGCRDEYSYTAAVLEKILDCALVSAGFQSRIANAILGRRLMVGQVPLEHFV